MRTSAIVAVVGVGCLAAVVMSQDRLPIRPQISLDQVKGADIIGSLGVPLGTCATVEGTILRQETMKGQDDEYLLQVWDVNGRRLAKPVVNPFKLHHSATANVKCGRSTRVVPPTFGNAPVQQSIAQRPPEEAYVNQLVKLIVYETGHYKGMPVGVPQSIPVWQDYAHHLRTEILIMDQLPVGK